MNLPGKLILGFIQEDNPMKGFFRVRPLMVEEENEFLPVDDAAQMFLEDGFIRVVPDKNELSHFKTRMRSLGQYCLIDLRRHIGENEKIRPNKNYPRDDHNSYIVYSDVVQRLPDTYMAEIYEGSCFPRPGTKYIMLKNGETLDGPYEWEGIDENSARAGAHVPADPDVADISLTRRTACETVIGPRQYLMRLKALGVKEKEPAFMQENAPERRRFEAFGAAVRPAEPAVKVVPAKAEEVAPTAEAAKPEAPVKAEAPAPVASAEPVAPAAPVAPAEPVKAEAPAKPEAPAAEPAAAEEAPAGEPAWITRTHFPPMRAISAKLTPREQSMVMQSGINPKRGASMRDVVDDQWRQSRLDQLGHPVPARVAAEPALSPVDEALKAFNAAWEEPDARAGLVRELLRNRELAASLDLIRSEPQTESDKELVASLTDLESQRLKMLTDLDKLRRDKVAVREEALAQLRSEHIQEIIRLEARERALSGEEEAAKQRADTARQAAEAAEAAYGKLKDGEDALCDRLAASKAASLLRKQVFEKVSVAAAPQVCALSAGEIIADVRVAFEKSGIPVGNDDAAHMLLCLALGRVLMVSGPSGCEAEKQVRILSRVLGLSASGRFAQMQARRRMGSAAQEISRTAPDGVPVIARPDVLSVLNITDGLAPTVLMLENANRTDACELLGEMLDLGEEGASKVLHGGADAPLADSLRVVMTASDLPEGTVLSPELLDRCWFTRLCPAGDDAPWGEAAEICPEADKVVSMAALEAAFAAKGDVSDDIRLRMSDLRKKLAGVGIRLSRRALKDTYRYCAAARSCMRCDDRELLDRALACRAMPWILATAEMAALHALPELMGDYPRCVQLMEQPLPLPPL